jgi:hypothetical protein
MRLEQRLEPMRLLQERKQLEREQVQELEQPLELEQELGLQLVCCKQPRQRQRRRLPRRVICSF